MENPFNTQLPGGEHPDIQLCLFPHLKEFLVIDLRKEPPGILLLNTGEVFTDEFFTAVEAEFSDVVRAETEFPFAYLIDLPLRLEEAIRQTAMTFILDRLGLDADVEPLPTVVVFIVSGGALAAQSELVLDGLKQLLRDQCGEPMAAEWEEVLARLIAEENAVLQGLNQRELTEALRGDSPDYFTLWENRN
tara:strand:+ start:195 stop:767 length:573 start_codon:yes stop_codon:yes gene_type:complete